MYDPHTRESRGFAFVTMVRAEDADAAMQAKRGRARTPTPGQYRGPPKRERAIGGMPGYYGYDRRTDRFDPRYDPRGPDPRDYRGGPMRDYARPAPYDRWAGGAASRYDDRPPRDYRPPYGMDRGYDDRSGYDRGYDRRPPSGYDDRYRRY
ncbi:hypothetical protein BGZ54_006947 [Gamsiella multidivaricata]|nr:hypothetical protein BGZ54_006947 [Gamsiella multidivaricata]